MQIMRFRLAFFDNDGTLADCPSSWHHVHSVMGTLEEANKMIKEYLEGKRTYEEFMIESIKLWESKLGRRVHLNDIQSILEVCKLREHAVEVVSKLKSAGMKIIIISAGMWLLSERVGRIVGADLILANQVKVDEAGYLTYEISKMVDPYKKADLVRELAEKFGVPLSHTIAVGDTLHDLNMLEVVGLGFLVTEKEVDLKDRPNIKQVRSLKDILSYVFNE